MEHRGGVAPPACTAAGEEAQTAFGSVLATCASK